MDPPRDRPASRSGSDFASPDRVARVLTIALELSCRIGLLPRRSVAWPGGIRSRPVPVRQARFLRVDTTLVAVLLALLRNRAQRCVGACCGRGAIKEGSQRSA